MKYSINKQVILVLFVCVSLQARVPAPLPVPHAGTQQPPELTTFIADIINPDYQMHRNSTLTINGDCVIADPHSINKGSGSLSITKDLSVGGDSTMQGTIHTSTLSCSKNASADSMIAATQMLVGPVSVKSPAVNNIVLDGTTGDVVLQGGLTCAGQANVNDDLKVDGSLYVGLLRSNQYSVSISSVTGDVTTAGCVAASKISTKGNDIFFATYEGVALAGKTDVVSISFTSPTAIARVSVYYIASWDAKDVLYKGEYFVKGDGSQVFTINDEETVHTDNDGDTISHATRLEEGAVIVSLKPQPAMMGTTELSSNICTEGILSIRVSGHDISAVTQVVSLPG